MKKDQIFKSRFLKVADLGGKPKVATVRFAAPETLRGFDGGEDREVMVLTFANGVKPLIVNSLHWDSLSAITGNDDSDGWAGATVELYPDTTALGGRQGPWLRIRAPSEPLLPIDDDIPFSR